MKHMFSSRRNKSPHNNENAEKSEAPFFSKMNKTPFFNNKSTPVQTKLSIGQPGDKYEKEADTMADAVVNKSSKPNIQNKDISSIQRESLATPQEDEKLGTAEQRMEEDKLIQEKPLIQKMEAPEEEMVQQMEGEEEEMLQKMEGEEEEEMVQRMEGEEEEGMINKMEGEEEEETLQTKSNSKTNTASKGLSQQLKSKSGKGRRLSESTQAEMESAFKTDFSDVNIHTDLDAIVLNKELGAQAFTHGKDVYFNSGKYNPDSSAGKHLLAHELTHVVQQKGKRKEPLDSPAIQRVVELRPPGRGEASAFDRAQELVNRLNAISNALEYRLEDRTLRYNVINEALQTHFDSQLRGYIDRNDVVPMRLITGEGYVGGGPLLVDSLQLGYVDLDDLLASDDFGFQSNIIHVLAERFAVRDYNRRLGTAGVGAEWARAHPVGLRAEAQFFQDVFNDPSIRYSWDRTSGNGNYLAVFRSTANGFKVLLQIRGGRRETRGTQISIKTSDGRNLTANAYLAEVARAAQAPAVQ